MYTKFYKVLNIIKIDVVQKRKETEREREGERERQRQREDGRPIEPRMCSGPRASARARCRGGVLRNIGARVLVLLDAAGGEGRER